MLTITELIHVLHFALADQVKYCPTRVETLDASSPGHISTICLREQSTWSLNHLDKQFLQDHANDQSLDVRRYCVFFST